MKRILSLVLVCAILFGALSLNGYAAEQKPLNKEPFIFIHGLNGWGKDEGIDGILPYWGATTGNLMDYLQEKGYECYSCSVGPMNSSWDRACELYAELTGTTVDYGEAHAKEHNHSRYGRAYTEALVPNWGQQTADGIQKIHLIGHSFGGTTARTLAQLLLEGSEAERAATPAEELSPLFQGGKGDWVKSITTLCTPHNSSTFFYPLYYTGLLQIGIFLCFLYAAVAGRIPALSNLVDFHLEQFGLTNSPGRRDALPFAQAFAKIFFSNATDYAHIDLLPKNAEKTNAWLDINPDIYYFSYSYSTTKPVGSTGLQAPSLKTNPVLSLTAFLMGVMPSFVDKDGYPVTAESRANDGMVTVVSAQYPWDEPHAEFNANRIEKGVWQVMPLREGDHGTAIGLLADADVTHALYDEIAQRLTALPD